MKASEIINAVTGLFWPILIGVLVWKLLPTIRGIINQRGFAIKVGGAEITVQQASEQLQGGVEDLREQVSALKLQVAGITGVSTTRASPISDGVPELRNILWVDDHPENNAYEMEALQRKGVKVQIERSTADGLQAADEADPPFDAIITDMGRHEDGRERPQAGLHLVAQLKDRGVSSPVFVYASAPAINRTRAKLDELGVKGTASATELLEMLGRLGQE